MTKADKTEIITAIYQHLIKMTKNGKIPIKMRPKLNVQDDPFDDWVRNEIRAVFPNYNIIETGPLMTPDIIIHDPVTDFFLSIEVKKLIQKKNGEDPRGLTLDYNSCVPCGSALIKYKNETIAIPCFYFFALLNQKSTQIVTSIFLDGDFINYDFNLHKQAKYANVSEYNHGPYGEGSVRNRKMYTYPNPLNSKIKFLNLRHTLIVKKPDFAKTQSANYSTEIIVRDDIYNNSFYYLVIDYLKRKAPKLKLESLPHHIDIFKGCKERTEKERSASIPSFQ